MSVENNEADKMLCCASCGIAEVDNIKLKDCDGCDLVRYCSDECQQNHKAEHKEACKKRAAELRDNILFKQPESTHLGDCPICCLPLPLDPTKSTLMGCCSKVICNGCDHANERREDEMRLAPKCPFCREAVPETKEECRKQNMKRVEANDPAAIRKEGIEQYNKGDYSSAFGYWTKAAELGDAEAHFNCQLCIVMGMVLRKTGERVFTMRKRLLLVVIPQLDTILDVTNGMIMIIMRGQ